VIGVIPSGRQEVRFVNDINPVRGNGPDPVDVYCL
jgi:hypothetical protein